MMDADFRKYLAAVKADEPPALSTDPRWQETEALARRLIAESKVEAALKSLEQEPLRRKRWDLLLLNALLREGLGEYAAALESFEVVADKLMASGDREGVRSLLDRFLEPEPTTPAVRLLVFLARGGGLSESERLDLLREAIEIRPSDPDLNGEVAAALERAGDADGARQHRVRSVELHLEAGHAERVSDDFLRLIEEDLEHHPARVGRALLRFASLVSFAESEPLLDLAVPELKQRAPGLISWDDIAPMAPRVPANAAGRKLLGTLLRIAVAREPEPGAILEGSGIEDATKPLDQVGARLPKILALPPGAHVGHTTWGLGRVRASDGENLTLDFPSRAGHRMSFAMASKSLDRLPGDGLRVLAAEDSAKARALAAAGDPEILVRVLRDVGGTATAAQLRPKLEAALPGVDVGAYWKQSKDAIKGDARLDSSEAYRQIFRLAPEGAAAGGAVLPQLQPKAATQGLGLIRKFLREHPDEEPRFRATAGPLVKRWSGDDTLDAPTRAQALCYALAWESLGEAAAREHLEALIRKGLRPDDLALSANQDQLLDLASESKLEEDFLWRAAESRLPRLRLRARARLNALLGARFPKAVENKITRWTEAPGLAARLIEHYAAHPDEAEAPPLGTLTVATLRLLEKDIPDGAPERLLALLEESGALQTRLRKEPPDEDTRSLLENVVLHWGGSERRLVPVLEAMRAIGMGSIAEEYESRRKARAQSLLEGKTTDDVETVFTVMTRPTYDRLEAELRRLALELKTTIPAAIEKARQLGDLRENAEYEAAKLKQANAAARLQELMTTLERTRLLETMEIDPSRIGVGTEAALKPADGNGGTITYWLLGDGDSGLAPGVLSYRAPLARPLLGKTVGSYVDLEYPEGTRRFLVESIVKRLP
ncbi:MAG TPA: GreA/GreB family elongation factor [Candidatus Eisenbacteria bacterium]|nr:GreA/GreB family elongation factor [Candidatus Eisenbacteria bacterium]